MSIIVGKKLIMYARIVKWYLTVPEHVKKNRLAYP